jgi:hypothetical protein
LIFKHKFNSGGSLERFKTRWVLHGFAQRLGVDYDETFSPVVKPATVCTVLSLAISHTWSVHQIDVKNVFLHSTLSETVYCNQPTGFVDPTQPGRVCLLNKSLYGLKQVPRAWYSRFTMYITFLGLLRPSSTPPYSSSDTAQIQYTCCFMLMTLFSLHPAQYLHSSGNSP